MSTGLSGTGKLAFTNNRIVKASTVRDVRLLVEKDGTTLERYI